MNWFKKINLWLGENYILVIILAILWAMLLRWPSHGEPLWYDDEAITLTVGRGLRAGEILYKDIIDHKTPLLYWMAAALPTLTMFKIGASVLMVMIVGAYGGITKMVLGEKFLGMWLAGGALITYVTLVNLPGVEGNLMNGEILMTSFGLWGWWCFWLYYGKRKNLWLLGSSGVLLGLGVMAKVPSGVDMIVGLLTVATIGLRYRKVKTIIKELSIWLGGIGLAMVTISMWFVYRGSLSDYVHFAWLYNLGYVEAWNGNHADVVTAASTLPMGIIVRGAIAVGLSGLIWIMKLEIKDKFIGWWFVWSLFGVLLSERPYPHYLLQVLPVASLLVWTIWSLKLRQAVVMIGLVSLLWVTQIMYGFWRYPILGYYENYWHWKNKRIDNVVYDNNFDPNVWAQYQVANYIKVQLKRNENIWVYSDKPGMYVLTEQNPVTKVVTAYHIADFGLEKETLEELEEAKPRFIVWGMVGKNIRKIDDWINANYKYDATFGNFEVWRRI